MRPALRRITVAALAAVILAPVAAWAHSTTRVPLELRRPPPAQRVRAAGDAAGKKGLRVSSPTRDAAPAEGMTPEQQRSRRGTSSSSR